MINETGIINEIEGSNITKVGVSNMIKVGVMTFVNINGKMTMWVVTDVQESTDGTTTVTFMPRDEYVASRKPIPQAASEPQTIAPHYPG